MSDMNGKNAAMIVDEEEALGQPNQRLLDPGSTPENLRTWAFGIGIPCPTRVMTRETAHSLRNLAYPMFGQAQLYSPDSLEVGEARNQIVEAALADGVKYLFFIDYDVAVPSNALIKLLSLKKDIAAGVYHLKQVPSYPLIFVKGWDYAFEDYDAGDLIKADGVGMGCTLINMEVFKKIEKPWFKTCPGYAAGTSKILPGMTEDIYFCEKARAAGFEIIVDTSVQCGHIDSKNGILYHYVPDPNGGPKGLPGLTFRHAETGTYITQTVPSASSEGFYRWAKTEPIPNVPKKKIDLGAGYGPKDGFVGIDKFILSPGGLLGDIADLSWYRVEHGLAESIRSSHSLEHMSHRDIPRIFRDWVNTLAPGGDIEVRVPDGEFHMRKMIELLDEGKDDEPQCDWLNATIYGLQVGEGQEHKTLFTERRLLALAVASGLEDVTIEKVVSKGNGANYPDTAELVLTGKRGV